MTKTLKHFQRITLVPMQWVDMWLKQTPGGILVSVAVVEKIWPLYVYDRIYNIYIGGFPGGTVVKNSPANTWGNVHLILHLEDLLER